MVGAILSLGVVSFVIAWVGTMTMKHVAPRIGFVDKPGHRKIHANPKPLGGGVAVFWAIALPVLGAIAYAWWGRPADETMAAYLGGARQQTAVALGLLGAMFVMHVMGLVDDKRALGPYSKLIVQLGVTAALVIGCDLRALTALGYWPSVVVTVLWITAITNAFNFLDNMDGLSAGIAAVCATAFLVTAILIGQWFVAGMLALLVGALVGFLCFNFPPATIFMGDSGSLIVGFLLGVLTVRTTFLPKGQDLAAGWYAVFAPLIVLALPLYDLIVVSLIRLSRGKSPFQGDTNHFSHRLVRRGMSKRTAVLCLWLVTAATSVAAIVLPHVGSSFAAVLLFVQTLLILGVVLLLEQHPLPLPKEETTT
jgi:UDP-GlcNAc:undecaprenyl-phosphate GlcNAc-1-phosphate transferase